jgi:hypothetical protein
MYNGVEASAYLADCFLLLLLVRKEVCEKKRKKKGGWLRLWIINRLVDSFDGISDLCSVGIHFL